MVKIDMHILVSESDKSNQEILQDTIYASVSESEIKNNQGFISEF